ncbi:MAG: hypothetical protein PWP41_825 [Moorella sp. (in: firmicutes)]|uniref:DGC domain protein n=1 Tax=Neomoorella thermoacetica TaxID=1525 RepID=A0A1J5NWE3_NEOTH|nr:hypothetical protein [Moorella sp. (in: firmicutes)]OIQ60071.1 DGC domain protein [Moorella thermoacetica]
MASKYVILPCNGLDKEAGCLARELALKMAAATGSEIICPVLYQTAPSRYAPLLREGSLVVIDGCASRIAANNDLKISEHAGGRVVEMIRAVDAFRNHRGVDTGTAAHLTAAGWQIADELAAGLAGKVDRWYDAGEEQ